MTGFGGAQRSTGTLRRVLVRAPLPDDHTAWRRFGWRDAPEPQRLAAEHEAFRAELEKAGAEVVVGKSPLADGPDPDAIYVYDPALLTNTGALMLRPGKEARLGEPAALAADLREAGVPIVGILEPPACAEGGDLLFLDDRTLLAGRSYRTNDSGIRAIRDALPGVRVLAFDLPNRSGAADVLHLMSLLSPLDRDLIVAHVPLVPVRLMELLAERGVRVVEVPDEEFESMGPNVLALGPRRALALEGNPETRRRMEQAGVEVHVYRGEEISRKGEGGPTCLTRPLLRD